MTMTISIDHDALRDRPDLLEIEHGQTYGGHYGYDSANCPTCQDEERVTCEFCEAKIDRFDAVSVGYGGGDRGDTVFACESCAYRL